ncbi:hypothetical protein FRB90_005150 [Tulasnella sp. 427]|nr:hypothetical protein FRB90_005150 [Tulasnella sp. 427]
MVEAQPELASQIRRVRGGYLKIQGTWLPYEVALKLARRPTFPDTCLAPDQPGYGQVIPSTGRKIKRSNSQAQPLATPRQDQFTATPLPSTSSSSPPRSRHRSPVRDTRYDLPPISAIDLPRPAQQGSISQGFSLPPITSLQGGDKPDMDASAVLRRLRLDEPGPGDAATPRSREDAYKAPYGVNQAPAYPPGPPTYYGDAGYQYGGDPRGREGGVDPRWSGQPPAGPGPQYHPGVTARGGSGRQW